MSIRSAAGKLAGALVLLALLGATDARAATIEVNDTADTVADTGTCTLREAIDSANADTASGPTLGECAAGSGSDVINFNFSGGGPHLMTPGSELPQITSPVAITAFNELHEVVLDGSVAEIVPGSEIALRVLADSSSVSNLTIVNWDYGIAVDDADDFTASFNLIGLNNSMVAAPNSVGVEIMAGSDRTTITGNAISANDQAGIRAISGTNEDLLVTNNRIGTNFFGTAAVGSQNIGIYLRGTTDAVIGGDEATEDNVISGNVTGISLNGTASLLPIGTLIEGNEIGTTQDGQSALPNIIGIQVAGDSRSTTIRGNLVSGNTQTGILVEDIFGTVNTPSGTAIRGNLIGTDADGESAIPNVTGVRFTDNANPIAAGNVVGGTTGLTTGSGCTGDCNLIGGNLGLGVAIFGTSEHVAVLGNLISLNGLLGIDLIEPLTADGSVSPNDALDADGGPNGLQNFPVIESAFQVGSAMRVTGRLESDPGETYRLEFFGNNSPDLSDHGEASAYLGAFNATTPASGLIRFGEILEGGLTGSGNFVTATATKLDVPNNRASTSEFSLNQADACDQIDSGNTGLLVADGSGQTLCGLTGDDELRGAAFGDILQGGDDTDTADFSLSPDSVTASILNQRAESANGVDLLIGIENLAGSPQGDILTGSPASEEIDGAGGADTINPGNGADTVLGGGGDDAIIVNEGVADTLVNCGPGNDTVTADPTLVEPASLFIDCETIIRPLEPEPTCETDPSLCPPPTCETDESLCPPELVVYKCDGIKATIVGTNNSETINGTDKRDVIVARAGKDKINPKKGNDLVCAGDGVDTVSGSGGNDRILGQEGADILKAGDGNDKLLGGPKDDKLYGHAHGDILKGGEGSDRIEGGSGADTLYGEGHGKDKLFGNQGKDKLNGGDGGKDLCDGGADKDRKKGPGCEKRKSLP